MLNNFTVASILAKMAFQIAPKNARYKVDSFTGWRNPDLCHVITSRGLVKRKNNSDFIVLVGVRYNPSNAGTYVFHSFLVDRNKKIVVDSNSSDTDAEYTWDAKKGYFQNDNLIGRTLDVISVKDFFDAMFSHAETMPAQARLQRIMARLETAVKHDPQMEAFLTIAYVILKYILTEDVSKIDQGIINYAKDKQYDAERFLARYKTSFENLQAVFDAIDEHKEYDDAKESIQALGRDLKTVAKRWQADRDIDMEYLKIMEAFGVFLRNRDSDNAKDFLLKNVGKLKDPMLLSMFKSVEDLGRKHEEIDMTNLKDTQENLTARINLLIEKMIGQPATRMNTAQKSEAKKKYPEEYALYLKLTGLRKTAAKDFLRLTVRNSGGELINYKKFVDRLNEEGIKHHYPPGFEGFIDEDGNLYTVAEKKIKGKPSAQITMNPEYDPKTDNEWVFSTPSPNPDEFNTTSYFYTVSYKKQAVKTKFIKAGELGEKLDSIKRKWRADITFETEDGVCASVIECLYYFAARIGSLGNEAHGESTYGISTLLQKHVRKQGSDFIFKYKGKKGTEQNHVLDTQNDVYRKIAPVLDMMMERSENPNAVFWTMPDKKGNMKPLKNSAIRKYWKALDPICAIVGPHKLRTAEATKMAKDILATCPFKPGQCEQKEVEDWYKEEMKKIGKRLQHRTGEAETGMTAIHSYIDAGLQRNFFDDMGLRQPGFLKDLEEDDED